LHGHSPVPEEHSSNFWCPRPIDRPVCAQVYSFALQGSNITFQQPWVRCLYRSARYNIRANVLRAGPVAIITAPSSVKTIDTKPNPAPSSITNFSCQSETPTTACKHGRRDRTLYLAKYEAFIMLERACILATINCFAYQTCARANLPASHGSQDSSQAIFHSARAQNLCLALPAVKSAWICGTPVPWNAHLLQGNLPLNHSAHENARLTLVHRGQVRWIEWYECMASLALHFLARSLSI
jgi:hypothetical protein